MAAAPTVWQRLEHAVRVRSAAGVALGALDTGGQRLFGPGTWRLAAWYAARIGETLRRPVRIDGATIHLPGDASRFLVGAVRLQRYEGLERYAVARFLPRQLPVIELGGGLGVVACLIDRLLRDRRQHWVVEANPALIPTLERTRAANLAGFHLVHGALAYESETVNVSAAEHALTRNTNRAIATVPALTFADLLRRSGFEQCSLVCDIEGAEHDLIRREGRLLAQVVGTMILEVHPTVAGVDRVNALRDDLRALGFDPVWSHDDVWVLSRKS
jgi:FkbM family methyltransferase